MLFTFLGGVSVNLTKAYEGNKDLFWLVVEESTVHGSTGVQTGGLCTWEGPEAEERTHTGVPLFNQSRVLGHRMWLFTFWVGIISDMLRVTSFKLFQIWSS